MDYYYYFLFPGGGGPIMGDLWALKGLIKEGTAFPFHSHPVCVQSVALFPIFSDCCHLMSSGVFLFTFSF